MFTPPPKHLSIPSNFKFLEITLVTSLTIDQPLMRTSFGWVLNKQRYNLTGLQGLRINTVSPHPHTPLHVTTLLELYCRILENNYFRDYLYYNIRLRL